MNTLIDICKDVAADTSPDEIRTKVFRALRKQLLRFAILLFVIIPLLYFASESIERKRLKDAAEWKQILETSQVDPDTAPQT